MVKTEEADKKGMDAFMVDGITEEKNTNKKDYALGQEQIKISGEVDFMQNIIAQRKEDINSIANIMADINAIAKDIAVETRAQGEKLEGLHDNLPTADNNTTAALKELNEAKGHQSKSGKCQYFLISILVLCILILIISVA